MTAQVIQKLAGLLPPDCGYFAGSLGRFLVGKCIIEMDPRFGWNFVNAFVQTGRLLPAEVLNSELQRTFYHLHYGEADEAVQTAIAWDFPRNAQRHVLNALLLCPDVAFSEISLIFGLSEEAVRTYEQLFFNVRDRLADSGYVAHLVYPLGEVPQTEEDFEREDPGQRFLRVAFEHGKKEVLQMAGLVRPQPGDLPVAKLAEEVERGLLARGVAALHHGQANSAEIKHAKDVVLARMKVTQPEQTLPLKGLEALSLNDGILETLRGIQEPDIQRRLYFDEPPKTPGSGPSPG